MTIDEFQQAFGNKVAEARKAKGIKSRYRLAKMTGLRTTDITQIEEGRRNATLDIIRRLSAALEVKPDYFFRW